MCIGVSFAKTEDAEFLEAVEDFLSVVSDNSDCVSDKSGESWELKRTCL